MPDQGKRKLQSRGQITLPQSWRKENNLEKGDHIKYKVHSRNRKKLVIEIQEK